MQNKNTKAVTTGPWNTSNVRPDVETWHDQNLSEGFVFFRVGITNQSTPEQIVTIQNKIKAIDEKANKIDQKTGRRIPNQKPYFRYTMIESDGTEKPLGEVGICTPGGLTQKTLDFTKTRRKS